MISDIFIDRPRLAIVIAIVISIAGALALMRIPVAQLPDIVPPQVSVTATYPGASAEVLEATVAQPIESKVIGVDKALYMKSTSGNDGSYTLTVSFALGTDPDINTVNVNNRVQTALSQLPADVQALGVTVQKKSSSILQFITLSSPDERYDPLFMTNYAVINVLDELARTPGVGSASLFGQMNYSMRIWFDVERLASLGMVPSDVIAAISAQNVQAPVGRIGARPVPDNQQFQLNVQTQGRLTSPEEFGNIVLRANRDGSVLKVKDVARVELGAQNEDSVNRLNGKPSVAIGIYLAPGANALTTSSAVTAKLKSLQSRMPEGLKAQIMYDSTDFVYDTIDAVIHTLIEAFMLVAAVVFLFLGNWRATLIPIIAVPVSIIGTFAVLLALGYSANTVSLLALVLAIGIVVDDAIVIVEGVARHMDDGLSSHEAAVKAMGELTGPIIGITLVLMAVFLPAATLSGLTGKMYQQFALVIAATALISAVNAVTLKPTQCALWLRKSVPPEERNIVYRAFNAVYGRCEAAYTALVRQLVAFALPTTLVGLALIGIAFYGLSRVPTGFLPEEDQGYFIVNLSLPDAASSARTDAAVTAAVKLVEKVPGVETVIGVSGISPLDNNATLYNAGMLYVVLKDWDQRKTADLSIASISGKARAALDGLDTAVAQVMLPPPIQGVGNASGLTMMVELKDGSSDFVALQNAAQQMVENASTQSGLSHVASTFNGQVKQLRLVVDRVKAEALGLTVGQVFQAVESYIGSTYVNQFTKFNNVFQVYVQADAPFRLQPGDVLKLKVKGADGRMVPLGTVARIADEAGPALVTLYNLYPAATVVGSPAAGFSSGEAMTLMGEVAAKSLPPSMGTAWTAMSYQEQVVGQQIYYVFAVALLLVYFVLAGQYESWVQPLAVILAVPLTLLGTVVALDLTGMSNDLYTQIGIVLLIALAAKNAILIVEYAREKRAEGLEPAAAAVEAARLRFRPILMTSFAFIFGMLPLVFASGAGAGARVSLGVAVVSGMLASTGLAVLFVPAFFTVLERLRPGRKAVGSDVTGGAG